MMIFIGNRCVWMYLFLLITVVLVSFPHEALRNHINRLKSVEGELKCFEGGGPLPDRDAFKGGVRYYEVLLKYNNDSLVYGNLGFCHFYLGNYTQALASYRKAIEKEPQLYFYYWDMGLLNYYLGDFEKSRYFFERALFYIPVTSKYYDKMRSRITDSKNENIHHYLLACYYRLSQDREDTYIKLAQCHRFLNNPAKMFEASSAGLQYFPKSQKLYYYAGLSRFLQNDYKNAIANFNKALSLDSNDVKAYYYRGLCFEKTGQKIARMVDFAKVAAMGENEKSDKEKFIEMKRMHLNTELIVLRYFM
ncbi:MAG: tetratricopeptide repeat protein [Candidatus Omnitrophica bacterium]|nr:tetratricopeptide repeat protein [Candidatus Omnitrophota bacterium]